MPEPGGWGARPREDNIRGARTTTILHIVGVKPVRSRGDTPQGISPPSRYGKTETPLAAEAPAPVVPEGIDGAGDKGRRRRLSTGT